MAATAKKYLDLEGLQRFKQDLDERKIGPLSVGTNGNLNVDGGLEVGGASTFAGNATFNGAVTFNGTVTGLDTSPTIRTIAGVMRVKSATGSATNIGSFSLRFFMYGTTAAGLGCGLFSIPAITSGMTMAGTLDLYVQQASLRAMFNALTFSGNLINSEGELLPFVVDKGIPSFDASTIKNFGTCSSPVSISSEG